MQVEHNGDVYWLVRTPPGLVSGGGWVAAADNIYILKYNVQGAMVDHIHPDMDATKNEISNFRFARSKTGKYVITGNLYSANTPITIGGNTVSHTMLMAAFNAQGTYLWKKENTLNDLSSMMQARPQVDAQGNIYYSGVCVKGDIFNGYTFTNPLIGGILSARSHPFIGKADSNGNYLWIKEGSGKNISPNNLVVLKNQNEIWLAGSSASVYWSSTQFIEPAPNSGIPIYVARFNSSGSLLGLGTVYRMNLEFRMAAARKMNPS